MDCIIRIASEVWVAIKPFKYIYQNTVSDSPLRSFVIHQCLYQVSPDGFEFYAECFPHQLLIDVAIYSARNLRREVLDEPFPSNKFYVLEN